MRITTIAESKLGMLVEDNLGQFAFAALHSNSNKITYMSYLIDDVKPVTYETNKSDNWRQQVMELMGY
jgi:hypothetical protein